jgi:small subunit ribosomal protein S17
MLATSRSVMQRTLGICCRAAPHIINVPASAPAISAAVQHMHWGVQQPPRPPQQLLAAPLSTSVSSAAAEVGDDEPLADHHLPKRLHTQFDGVVVSTAMQKSILVAVTRTRLNRKYNKRQRYTRKFMAHDEGETCALGDRVRIQMSRPISKHKKFKYVMTLAKAEQL